MSKLRRVWIIVSVFLVLSVLSSFVFVRRAFSYDTNIAHPNIVRLAAEFYNKNYDPDLTKEEIDWLSRGAIDEDMPTRWFNHFYDPIYNKGFKDQFPTAKSWSRLSNYQSTFALGDQTWFRAIDYLQKGDRKNAFIALGHVLHLIADMSVPAHTRDDAHPTGDSYEQFVKNNWVQLSKQINSFEKKQVSSLDNVFDALTKYSNGNFYSDDTIKIPKYNTVDIVDEKEEKNSLGKVQSYKYASVDDVKYRVYVSDVNFVWQKKTETGVTVKDKYVLTDYFQHLLLPATSYSAATINLFFEEAKKEQNVKLSKSKIGLLGAADYLLGTVINKVGGLFDKFKSKDEGVVVASEGTQISDTNSPPILTTTNNTNLARDAVSQPTVSDTTQNPVNKTQTSETTSETVATIVEKPVEVESGVEVEKPVKVEEPKPVVKPAVPVAPVVVQPIVYSYGGGGHVGGGGGGGGASGDTTQDATNTTQITTSTEQTTTTTTVETADNAQTVTSTVEAVSSAVSQEPTTTTTDDIIQNTDSTIQQTTSTESITTTTLDVIITTSTLDLTVTSTLEQVTTSTEQTVTTTLDIIITTSPPEAGPPLVDTVSTTSTLEQTTTSTLPVVETPPPPVVVINEIAWAGTASNKSKDEWIELYSNATSTIDLTGWKILVNDKEIKLSGAISVGGYYLLERTKDKTVMDITADKIFTLSDGLNNSGARLRLVNAVGDIVDEVDCYSGWFAGDNIKYRSMARRSTVVSGNEPSNWFSSQGMSSKGKADGGGVIYGSPRFTNHGYWLLKSPTFYYSDLFDAGQVLTLTKENSPYLIDYSTSIPVGYTLKIEPGVVLVGVDKTSYLSVAGNLLTNGTAEAPIVFTSVLDTNYVQTNLTNLTGSAGPGDWSRIQVEPGGNFTGSFVKFLYGGKTFKKSPGVMFATHFYSNVIHNYGGSVSLDNAEFSSSYFDFSSDNEPYSALIFVEAPLGYDASLTVSNSNFNGGWRAIKTFRQENGQTIITNLIGNTFQNFQSPDGVVISRRDFVDLFGSVFEGNASDAVDVETWTLSRDYTFSSSVQYAFNSIFIPSGIVLTIDPGVRIKLAKYGSIAVEGSVQANGTLEQPVIIESQNSSEKWGYIKFKNSNSVFNYANFISGNLTSGLKEDVSGAIMAEDSQLNLNNVNVLNSRAPGNSIYSFNSNLNITNSTIGYIEEPDFDTTGIRAKGGSVILDNVTLQNLKFGIYGRQGDDGLLPHLELNNMTESNFINVDYLWEPNTWLSPAE